MTLRGKFVVYLLLIHLPFAALAVYVFATNRLLLFAVEALFLLSFLAGVHLVRSFFRPLDLIRAGGQFIQESDFSTRFREPGQPDMDHLVRIYNQMVDHLREERIQLEEQHFFLEKILTASPSGIITLDLDGRIAMVNPGAETMLQIPSRALHGRTVAEIEGPIARELAALEPGASRVVPILGSRRVKCSRSEFLDRGFARTFFVMEELTEELRQSEKAAYEKLIRMMSHEVNNSVGAASSLLESCLNYKDQIRGDDRDDFESALRVVIARARQLNGFMRRFSDVVRIPPLNLQKGDLRELLEDAVALFRAEAERRRIHWVWDIPAGELGPLAMDRAQMEQVLVNIIKNALEAIGEGGAITIRAGRVGDQPSGPANEARGGAGGGESSGAGGGAAGGAGDIAAAGARMLQALLPPPPGTTRDRLWLVIEDTGGGITPEVRNNLFTPFYSTKRNGQGIGLTMVQEILTQHGFGFSLEGVPGGTTRFTIAFSSGRATEGR